MRWSCFSVDPVSRVVIMRMLRGRLVGWAGAGICRPFTKARAISFELALDNELLRRSESVCSDCERTLGVAE